MANENKKPGERKSRQTRKPGASAAEETNGTKTDSKGTEQPKGGKKGGLFDVFGMGMVLPAAGLLMDVFKKNSVTAGSVSFDACECGSTTYTLSVTLKPKPKAVEPKHSEGPKAEATA